MEIERQRREVIFCEKCGRPNGSDRAACFYCGDSFPDRPRAAEMPAFLAADDWQPGFNVVIRGPLTERSAEIAARISRLEAAEISPMIGVSNFFPLARLAARANAEQMKQAFDAADIESIVVPDDDLSISEPNRRLRSIKIAGEMASFCDFNAHSETTCRSDEISILVFGHLTESETTEMRKNARRDSRAQGVEARCDRDEPVIDIYFSGKMTGLRLQPTGFDFSCLGVEMQPLAHENWSLLTSMLIKSLPTAKFDDTYRRLRTALDEVWPCEIRNASKGMTVTGLGKRSFAGSSVVSNARQFLRYSRMCRHLL